jgi:hypothetical protein
MKISNIKANTPEWKEARKNYVGASEIYSLVYHYCYAELEQISKRLELPIEKPWKGAYEIWHKIKYGHELEMDNQDDAYFGKEMERYIIGWIERNMFSSLSQFSLARLLTSNEFNSNKYGEGFFVLNSDFHILAACSPDLFAKKEMLFELKTSRYLKEQKSKLKYIFQLQYQMTICAIEKGNLIIAFSKDPKFDTDFQRGYILGGLKGMDYIQNYFDIKNFQFGSDLEIQELCQKALNYLHNDILNNNPPTSINPKTNELDFAAWNKDLKLMAMVNKACGPEWVIDTELNQALEDYKHGKEQIAAINAEIAQNAEYRIRKELLSHTELIGNNFRAYYDKGNKLRVQREK